MHQEIGFIELKSALEENRVVLVDVRNKEELAETGRITNSFCVPLPEIPTAFSSSMTASDFELVYGFPRPAQGDANSHVVLTCRSGKRAATAAQQLKELGFDNISVYPGSFQDWKARDGPVEKFSASSLDFTQRVTFDTKPTKDEK